MKMIKISAGLESNQHQGQPPRQLETSLDAVTIPALRHTRHISSAGTRQALTLHYLVCTEASFHLDDVFHWKTKQTDGPG